MKSLFDGLEEITIRQQLDLIQRYQRETSSGLARLHFQDGSFADVLIFHVGGNYVEFKAAPDSKRTEGFQKLAGVEYPIIENIAA